MKRINQIRIFFVFASLILASHSEISSGSTSDQSEIIYLNDRIADERLQWTAGETSVSQMNEEQRLLLSGGLATPPEDIDPDQIWHPSKFISQTTLPSKYDLRKYKVAGHSIITPVKNQRSCGSCWAFSAVGNLEAISRRSGINKILSEQTLLNCSAGICKGWYLNSTFDFLISWGTNLKSESPYINHKANCAPYNPVSSVRSWAWINPTSTPTDTTDNAIRNFIYMTKKPVSSRMLLYNSFYNYRSGVYQHLAEESDNGGHFVLIVGWGKTVGGTNYWICKNSWGKRFGRDGYFYIKTQDSLIGTNAIGATLQ